MHPSSEEASLAGADPHEFDPSLASSLASAPSPVRGASLYMQGKKAEASARNLAQEITLDRIDDMDASILRAQEDATTDDAFEDTDTEEVDHPHRRLATLTDEFGEWSGPGAEEFITQLPGALYRGVLIKGELVASRQGLRCGIDS